MRLLSVLWGLVALLCWYTVVKRLAGSGSSALLAGALLAVDFHFLMSAGNGRMDMMTFALESAGLAAYLGWRKFCLTRAVLVSHCLAAAGVFTHPMGVLGAAGLVFVSVYYDWKRIRPVHIVAAMPYLAAGMAWALYILQSPADFAAQFLTNASGRCGFFAAPLAVLRNEIELRYLSLYGLGPGAPAASRLKAIIFAIYAAGVLLSFGLRGIRKHPRIRMLPALAAWNVIGLTLLDSFRMGWYLLHIIPFAIVLLAISLTYLWKTRRVPRAVLSLVVALLVAVQMMVFVYRITQNERRDFLAAAGFLRGHLDKYQLVMASAEFGIPFQFDRRLVDDCCLGYRSGKRLDLIVMDTPRYCVWTELLRDQDAGNYAYIHNLLILLGHKRTF